MKAIKTIGLGLALTTFLGVSAMAADTNDPWLTAKTKIALLTAENMSARGINVDTVDGVVTLHGKVRTENDKERAATVARGIEGVKSVKNLLQVVPEASRSMVKASDDVVKERVQAALRGDSTVSGVSIASVNNGVVLLSGKVPTLTEKLRAIELVANVDGVARVSSEIETSK
jgi:hyperosmotically inducible periplasmic protein